MFATPISVAENTSAVGAAGFYAATAVPGPVTYILQGANSNLFGISTAGTLTFDPAPDFEMPAGGTGSSNTYTFSILAQNGNPAGDLG